MAGEPEFTSEDAQRVADEIVGHPAPTIDGGVGDIVTNLGIEDEGAEDS